MKKIASAMALGLALAFTGCDLDTVPTDKMASTELQSTVDGEMAAMNGIYRAFYVDENWSTSYSTENFGLCAHHLMNELMGEDFVQNEPGSYWFTYDYYYWVRTEINNTSDRPHNLWNFYYQMINNANNVLASIDAAEGDEDRRANIKAQALTVRAFCYSRLISYYQRTYVGHEQDPGVPLYLEPTTAETEGKARGTVQQVYDQINKDLDEAIALFQQSNLSQDHISHVDLYVAYGIQSRVALVQHDWQKAANAAEAALRKPGLSLMSTKDLLSGFNSCANSEWMWGSEIIESQGTSWASFFCLMDADAEGYASYARMCCSSWLYVMMDEDDVRKSWFEPAIPADEEEELGSHVSYCQHKYKVKSSSSWTADYLYMRAAEMYLNRAEALCRLKQYAEARQVLTDLCASRYDEGNFDLRLAKVTDSDEQTLESTESMEVKTLLDEILLQRRIELWGEGFRILDIDRLKIPMIRDYTTPVSNHTYYAQFSLEPDSWYPIMMLPMSEFDANPAMDPTKDQNP